MTAPNLFDLLCIVFTTGRATSRPFEKVLIKMARKSLILRRALISFLSFSKSEELGVREKKIAPALGQAYELGQWMGRKQAFSGLAGRCSAADAECLRQIRSRKQYRALKLTWRQFCEQRVGVSQVTADRIIGLLEEFGPAYFLLSQATRISEREYRQISSAVRGQNLLCAGEEIPIDADHAPKLNAAIEQLRRESAAALPAEAHAKGLPAEAHAKGASG